MSFVIVEIGTLVCFVVPVMNVGTGRAKTTNFLDLVF